MNENIGIKILTKEGAEMEILFIRDQVAAFGANDSELPEINRIIEELKKGTISPENALRQAEIIQLSKNDRH